MDKIQYLTRSENFLAYSKRLATAIGLKECIVLTEIIKQKKENVFFVNTESINNNVLDFISNSTFKRIISNLVDKKLLKKVNTNRSLIIEKLKSKPAVIGVGNKQCSICKSITAQIHNHHYPIKACEGGTETIELCPNCHFEFHFMEYNYEINYVEIEKILNKGGMKQCLK